MKLSGVLRPPANVTLIAKVSFGLLIVYQFLRLCFFLFNGHKFNGVETQELVFAFLHGTRFDLYAVLWLNAPLFLSLLFGT